MSLVSIGLPVYNGENYVKNAIESILNQTFKDFELIICDNASTDGTEAICREYAAKDDRIIYHRNEKNIGAGPNFNLTFEMASGKYFKWSAHDDICKPEYLEECVKVLEKDESVVLCHSDMTWIDYQNRQVKGYGYLLPGMDSNDCKVRFKQLISTGHGCFDVFGLIRKDILGKTPLIASFIGSDRSLLAELGLYGKLVRVPKVLFLSRDHSSRSIRALNLYERSNWWDTSLKQKLYLPWWRLLSEIPPIIKRVPISFGQKLRCSTVIPVWAFKCRKYLLKEALIFLVYPFTFFRKKKEA